MIETPDFARSALMFLIVPNLRYRILRHVFGSQEAAWAIYLGGWYASKFKYTLGHWSQVKEFKILSREQFLPL